LKNKGYLAMGGQIIDALLEDGPMTERTHDNRKKIQGRI
jgi:hypothetical protein